MHNPLTVMLCAVTRALTTVDDALDVWDPLYEDEIDSAVG